MITAILCVVITLCCIYFMKLKWRTTTTNLPGPSGKFLIGNTFDFSAFDMKHNTMKLLEYAEQFGDIFTVTILGQRVVCLNSPDVVRHFILESPHSDLTNNRPSMFYKKHFFNGVDSPALSDFNNVTNGLKRGLIRGLHVYGDGVKAFEKTVMEEVNDVMERIERHQDREFEFVQEIEIAMASIISALLCGDDFPREEYANLLHRYAQSMDRVLKPAFDGSLNIFPLLRFAPGYYRTMLHTHAEMQSEVLEKFFYSIKSSYKHGHVRGLVDYILSEQKTAIEAGSDVLFTDERIQTSIMDIIGAGNVTSRTALSAMVLCLINYPEIQARLHTEIDKVIGKDRLPTLADRSSCTFMEAFGLELQRYVTIAPLWIPHFCKTKFDYKGYTIPENSIIIPNVWFIHHNESIWGDPWTFRPERFLDSDGKLIEKEHLFRKSWMPFGIGKRHCLGESFARSRLFLFLASFLQRWKFLPPEGVNCNPQSCDPRNEGFETNLANSIKPFFCRIEKRV